MKIWERQSKCNHVKKKQKHLVSSTDRAIRDLTDPNEPVIRLDQLLNLVFVKGKKH